MTLTRYRILERAGQYRMQLTVLWCFLWRDIADTSYGVYWSRDKFTYSSEALARKALETYQFNERQRRAPWRRVSV